MKNNKKKVFNFFPPVKSIHTLKNYILNDNRIIINIIIISITIMFIIIIITIINIFFYSIVKVENIKKKRKKNS